MTMVMNYGAPSQGEQASVINELKEQLAQANSQISELEKALSKVDYEGEEYLSERCKKVMEQIAHDRMSLDVADQAANNRMVGMYQGVKALCEHSQNLTEDLNNLFLNKSDLLMQIEEAEKALKTPGEI